MEATEVEPMKICVFQETLDSIESLKREAPAPGDLNVMRTSGGCRMYIDEGNLLSRGVDVILKGKPIAYEHGKDSVRMDHVIMINPFVRQRLMQLYGEKIPDGSVSLEEFAGDCLDSGVLDKIGEMLNRVTTFMEAIRRVDTEMQKAEEPK